MIYHTIKRLRLEKGISRNEMAKALNIEPNTYSSIETGKTKLIDTDRINLIAHTLGVQPSELINTQETHQHFYDKVENGYASFIQTLNADNKELLQSLKDQLFSKDQQIEKLLLQNDRLAQILEKKSI
ncbi:MAG: helix-turn-helix transcriptional regulator [Chitinophagaceae bacterium]